VITLGRRIAAEGVGTAFLLIAVVGSGIMGERLFPGNAGLVLLVNSLATGAALIALILALGPISGAHLNPLVTLADACLGIRSWREVPLYGAAQVAGAFSGVAAANAMFGQPAFAFSHRIRAGTPQALGEFVATLGLLVVVFAAAHGSPGMAAFAVGSYIAGAYWFTSSTSFANPAVTLARSVTDTFSGIRPADVPGFLVAQLLGAAVAVALLYWLIAPRREKQP
jgi:glycerol uptake facilitator-like aquaporin